MLLTQFFVDAEAIELPIKFKFGPKDYSKMRDDILAFANDERHSELYIGAKDVDVDCILPCKAAWSAADWEEWYQYQPPT